MGDLLYYLRIIRICNWNSQGIIEAPSFKTITINIGDRQIHLVKSKKVINCKINLKSILEYKERNVKRSKKEIKIKNPYEIPVIKKS